MKIPKIKIHYYYQDPKPPIQVRYGIDRDGLYFFEIFNPIRHGGSWAFQSIQHKNWVEYSKYLDTLDVRTRLKKVKHIVNLLLSKTSSMGIPILGVLKFKSQTLFIDKPWEIH